MSLIHGNCIFCKHFKSHDEPCNKCFWIKENNSDEDYWEANEVEE